MFRSHYSLIATRSTHYARYRKPCDLTVIAKIHRGTPTIGRSREITPIWPPKGTHPCTRRKLGNSNGAGLRERRLLSTSGSNSWCSCRAGRRHTCHSSKRALAQFHRSQVHPARVEHAAGQRSGCTWRPEPLWHCRAGTWKATVGARAAAVTTFRTTGVSKNDTFFAGCKCHAQLPARRPLRPLRLSVGLAVKGPRRHGEEGGGARRLTRGGRKREGSDAVSFRGSRPCRTSPSGPSPRASPRGRTRRGGRKREGLCARDFWVHAREAQMA